MYLVVLIVRERAPPGRVLAAYGVTGAPGAGLGMRRVYTKPKTMVVPFVVANALVFLLAFEERIPIMLKIDIVGLPTGGMHVIEGDQPFKGIDDCVVASVARELAPGRTR